MLTELYTVAICSTALYIVTAIDRSTISAKAVVPMPRVLVSFATPAFSQLMTSLRSQDRRAANMQIGDCVFAAAGAALSDGAAFPQDDLSILPSKPIGRCLLISA